MAHRTNVTPVMRSFQAAQALSEVVIDPVCGKEIERKHSRHMVFRLETAYYFCSKECQQKFLYPASSPAKRAI